MQMAQRWTLILLIGTALQLFAAEAAKPAEQKFVATLIWGTDGDKPDDKELKEVDPALKEKFKKIFKWKNYYEVSRTKVDVKAGEPKQVMLSKKCEVKIHLTEKEGM